MASLFTHALVGTALGQAGISDWRKDWRFWCLVIVCSILPDIDSIGFLMGVPYGNLWGHRGMTHSLVFSRSPCALPLGMLQQSVSPASGSSRVLLFRGDGFARRSGCHDQRRIGCRLLLSLQSATLLLFVAADSCLSHRLTRFFTNRGLRIYASEILWVWCRPQHLGLVVAIKTGQLWRRYLEAQKRNQSG